ncbi:uncharacterized protein J4E88_006107 [Alternaria novae-zelandiae]|uniref:uncharacterized protein n=1 Tax=Alternaria novae-zelandiae TaxID=430562 RepID=UPI0020C35953|nr:uncharacterized protein J4E88_006107 [Alternaria novae-zelandiae]KAI4680215.1 hypothetical protein J4E88_006107 [Alternaria novae-zelandiae]
MDPDQQILCMMAIEGQTLHCMGLKIDLEVAAAVIKHHGKIWLLILVPDRDLVDARKHTVQNVKDLVHPIDLIVESLEDTGAHIGVTKGPDGTPFGSLPEYKSKGGIGMGLGDHIMATYRHIKAEHEAGHRTKGALENAIDGMRKKKTDAKDYSDRLREGERKEREKIRKSEPERVRWAERKPEKTRGDESKQKAAEKEARERHRHEQDERRRRREYEKQLEHEHRENRRQEEDRKKDRSSPIPEIRVQPPTASGTPRGEQDELRERQRQDEKLKQIEEQRQEEKHWQDEKRRQDEERRQEEDRKKNRSSPVPKVRAQPPAFGGTHIPQSTPVARDSQAPTAPKYAPPPAPRRPSRPIRPNTPPNRTHPIAPVAHDWYAQPPAPEEQDCLRCLNMVQEQATTTKPQVRRCQGAMEIISTMIIWSMEGMMNSPFVMKCRTWAHALPL